jgi:hypothetical protein
MRSPFPKRAWGSYHDTSLHIASDSLKKNYMQCFAVRAVNLILATNELANVQNATFSLDRVITAHSQRAGRVCHGTKPYHS